jgi:hypothetical protein
MSLNFSYVNELETLITDTLLPVYANYQARMGSKDRYYGINPELLKLIKVKKKLPALLLPKENLS